MRGKFRYICEKCGNLLESPIPVREAIHASCPKKIQGRVLPRYVEEETK